MVNVIRYNHPLGEQVLSVFAVDPQITETELAEMVKTKDNTSKFDLAKLSQDISYKGTLADVSELQVQVLDESYKVPEKLKPYREALEAKLTAEGKFNGPVAVLDGEFGKTIRLRKGGYFDFMATKLEVIPAKLVPDKYPAGATVEKLMPEFGIKNEDRARYLGFAFLMLPDSKKEFQLVQRAKGMGIAADCISSSGSTPEFSEDFFKPGFNFAEFYAEHIAREMNEEYKMKKGEFVLGEGFIAEDKRTVPHIAWTIQTSPSTAELAEKIYGNQEAIKEHPVLYSMSPDDIGIFLRKFDMWPSVAFISDLFYKTNILKE